MCKVTKEAVWLQRFSELKAHYRVNPDTSKDSFQDNATLKNWVRTQRAAYKSLQDGNPGAISQERIDMLEAIDFHWKVRGDWMHRYDQLADYFDEYGNSCVPTTWEENLALGRWVDRQRTQYKHFQQGKPSSMTPDRIELLRRLNFKWTVRDQWPSRYQELVQYYQRHGNSMVPSRCPSQPGLAKWVDTNRQQYRLWMQNKPSSMTKERINLLNKVNFQWKLLEEWMERYRDLEAYVERNGDALVPQHFAEDPSLGIWVRNQRSQYKLYNQGKASKLSKERIQMLEALGFEWSAYEAKWMAGFVELGHFVRLHGIGTIPTYNQDRKLRSWVEEQRRQYRKLFTDIKQSNGSGEGERKSTRRQPPALSQKRRELLDLLGFPWPKVPESAQTVSAAKVEGASALTSDDGDESSQPSNA